MGKGRRVRALPTTYNGYKFLSKQEAKWAFYFDQLGIEYLYEPEGYILSSGECYVPDFYLPDFVCFAEVKGGLIKNKDMGKITSLAKDTMIPIAVINRYPDFKHHELIYPSRDGKELKTKSINIVQDPDRKKGKFLTSRYLNTKEDFKEHGFQEAIDAVYATRAEDFGVRDR